MVPTMYSASGIGTGVSFYPQFASKLNLTGMNISVNIEDIAFFGKITLISQL